MSLNKYYHYMGMAKGLLVMALILIIMGWAVCGYCHTFEMDYSGPGSEFEKSDERCRDDRNKEANDRWNANDRENKETSPRDVERAMDYQRDHGA